MRKAVDFFVSIISICVFIVVIYMLLLKLTGHSLTLSQTNTALIVGLGAITFKMNFDMGKLTEFMERSKENVKEVKTDVKEIRKDLSVLKSDMFFIKSKLA